MGTLIQPGGSGVLLLDPGEGSPNRVENVPVGQSSPAWSASTDANSVKMSPDGRFIVGDRDITGDDVVVLDGTNGAMVATVPTPAGATLCRSANWWSDDELVVDCQVGVEGRHHRGQDRPQAVGHGATPRIRTMAGTYCH